MTKKLPDYDDTKLDLENYQFTDDRLEEFNIEKLNKDERLFIISHLHKLSSDFLLKYFNYFTPLEWKHIIVNQKLSEEAIDILMDGEVINDWSLIFTYQDLSEEYMIKKYDLVQKSYIKCDKVYSDKFLEVFKKKLNWNLYSQFIGDKIDNNFIDKWKKYIDINYYINFVLKHNLTIDFLERYEKYIDFNRLHPIYVKREIYNRFKDKFNDFMKLQILYSKGEIKYPLGPQERLDRIEKVLNIN